MEGQSAYYGVNVEEAAAILQLTPEHVRELLMSGELEGIPPGATAQGDWKVLLPATPDLEEPAPANEPSESSSEEQEEPPPVEETPQSGSEDSEEPAGRVDPDEPTDEPPRETDEDVRRDMGESGWTTTKQAAKVLGVSRRSVQGYVRRGLIEAREEGEGVNKTFLISIDSLNALRDRRNREVGAAAKFAEAAAEEERNANLYANAGEALRHAIERVEARTVEATELRIRLEITEKAESTLRAELEEERRKREVAEHEREVAERERDELRRRLEARPEEARPEPREAPSEAAVDTERAEPRPSAGEAQEPSQPRESPEIVADEQQGRGSVTHDEGPHGGTGHPHERQDPWWRRMFGG
jgi:outer membrane biosynthesis protein TonB